MFLAATVFNSILLPHVSHRLAATQESTPSSRFQSTESIWPSVPRLNESSRQIWYPDLSDIQNIDEIPRSDIFSLWSLGQLVWLSGCQDWKPDLLSAASIWQSQPVRSDVWHLQWPVSDQNQTCDLPRPRPVWLPATYNWRKWRNWVKLTFYRANHPPLPPPPTHTHWSFVCSQLTQLGDRWETVDYRR